MIRSKVKAKKLDLAPYPGAVMLYDSLADLRIAYKEYTGEAYPYEDEPAGGRYIQIVHDSKDSSKKRYLVYARTAHVLAHELSHVILIVFDECGIDPVAAKGEPFCYMLSHLMIQAGATGRVR